MEATIVTCNVVEEEEETSLSHESCLLGFRAVRDAKPLLPAGEHRGPSQWPHRILTFFSPCQKVKVTRALGLKCDNVRKGILTYVYSWL